MEIFKLKVVCIGDVDGKLMNGWTVVIVYVLSPVENIQGEFPAPVAMKMSPSKPAMTVMVEAPPPEAATVTVAVDPDCPMVAPTKFKVVALPLTEPSS